jgi:hypothetical protein
VLRPIPFALAFAALLRARGLPVDPSAAHRSDALAKAIARQGLVATSADVTWLDEPRGGFLSRRARAVVRAATKDEPPSLHLIETRLSPEGVLLDVGAPVRLTRSAGVEESPPAVHGDHLATALIAGGNVVSIALVDLGGEPRPEGPAWTTVARAQNAITNWQETGQSAGIGRRTFQLSPASAAIDLRFEAGQLVVSGGGREARVAEVLPPGAHDEDGAWLRPQPFEKGQVGNLVTWAVDRFRQASWFGDENMQRLKAVAFDVYDTATRAKSKVVSDDTAKDIAADMGDANAAAPDAFTDPETGWPPPPIDPFLSQKIPGEGEWRLLEKDPFVRVSPGSPPAFATAFIRTDRERPYTRIYVALWDPRQVSLHPVAGTVEPTTATGAAGPGTIPRTPVAMKQLVAAFNGGFQAMHGEFGMMADGTVYLPPKPYGATVAELRDGSTAFGVWPNDPGIPEDIVGYRQNLTPLVLDGKLNPYQRTWWGGTPADWADRSHTTRSGLCLTREGFVGYFYGNGIDADVLGQAMIQARCKLGMHLDMNPGHTGLEFYNVAPAESFPALGRAYQNDWESEGEVGSMPGVRFRARRMVRGMGLMNFPRYIQREARDFFWLSLRATLPGADLPPRVLPGEPGEGVWRVKQLPQHGFPSAIAVTTLRPDPARPDLRVRLLSLDPHVLRPAGKEDAPTVVTLASSAPHAGEPGLFLGPSGFVIAREAPPRAAVLAGGTTSLDQAEAVVGIDAETGFLRYAEVDGTAKPGDARALDALLASMGCKDRMALPKPLAPLLGGATTLSNAVGRRTGAEIKLVRAPGPGGRSIFPDTPVLPQSEWGPLQMKRIRYFKKAE